MANKLAAHRRIRPLNTRSSSRPAAPAPEESDRVTRFLASATKATGTARLDSAEAQLKSTKISLRHSSPATNYVCRVIGRPNEHGPLEKSHSPPDDRLAGERRPCSSPACSRRCSRRNPPIRSRPRRPCSRQGQAGHLSLHERRRLARRLLRPQAAPSAPTTTRITRKDFLHGSPWTSKSYSKNGTEVTELFPHVGACMDDICLDPLHAQRHSEPLAGHPRRSTAAPLCKPAPASVRGSARPRHHERNLPSYVVLAPEMPYAGSAVWDSSFLPAFHQGIRVVPGQEAIPNIDPLQPPPSCRRWNSAWSSSSTNATSPTHDADAPRRAHQDVRDRFRHAGEAPEVFDLARETDATLDTLRHQARHPQGFGWQCLMARRLAERGVRFVELIDGGDDKYTTGTRTATSACTSRWPARPTSRSRPAQRSEGRGMLDDTLVVWTTEFGRTPVTHRTKTAAQSGTADSSWLAGGGVKGGIVYGASDEYGERRRRTGPRPRLPRDHPAPARPRSHESSRTATPAATSA